MLAAVHFECECSMSFVIRGCVILALIAGRAIHADEITPTVDRSSISLIAQPFFNEHCIRCHGASEMKAELRSWTCAEPQVM